jgi:hypothetical protein
VVSVAVSGVTVLEEAARAAVVVGLLEAWDWEAEAMVAEALVAAALAVAALAAAAQAVEARASV